MSRSFPDGFTWGAATAAFQIEGNREGRGDSIWDALCAEPGRIADGSNGDVACDHVRRYREDIGLLRDLGVGAYRFSIAWPRVQPDGSGRLEPAGLAFYDSLVDGLLDAGITPFPTLYHWDLPLPLHESGGWPERDVVDRFADYAEAVHDVLGDRVTHWATLNEPWVAAWMGYGAGVHAPGITDHRLAVRASHHLLLAHGRALQRIRAGRHDAQLGIVLNLMRAVPAGGSSGQVSEAVKVAARNTDLVQNRWFCDALLAGEYPAQALELFDPYLDGLIQEGDLAEIAQPLDWLGVNYYFDHVVEAAAPLADDEGAYPYAGAARAVDPGDDGTDMGWPITPEGLTAVLNRLREEYPTLPPVYVTENGAAYDDPVRPDGVIDDTRRISYLQEHLHALADAIDAGVDVRGYFVWSLLDNFEWAQGYAKRFGLVHVDYRTQRRTPRRSFAYYRDVATSGAVPAP